MTSPDDPLPDGVVCVVQVVRQVNDRGTEYNEVRKVKYLRTEENPLHQQATTNRPARRQLQKRCQFWPPFPKLTPRNPRSSCWTTGFQR